MVYPEVILRKRGPLGFWHSFRDRSLAPIIIDDKLSDLSAPRDSLTQDQALSFIEKLSEDVSRDAKKKEFLRVMTDFLNTEQK